MFLETAAFFRFYNVAGSSNYELNEKFEFVVKDFNPIIYGSKPIILSLSTHFSNARIFNLSTFFFCMNQVCPKRERKTVNNTVLKKIIETLKKATSH